MEQESKSGSVFISVVLPVLNEGKFIGPVLEALIGQEYPAYRYEILVVDGGSTDETRSIVSNMNKSSEHPTARESATALKLRKKRWSKSSKGRRGSLY